jgi:hypothetical protein
MARATKDPPSPVDAYESPALASPIGDPRNPGHYEPQPPAPQRAASGDLNDLAVIALIASCIGLSIPGLVMGHIALGQIKRTGQTGHGFALAAVIVGWAVTVLVVLAIVAFIVFMIVVFSVAGSAVDTFGQFG